MAMDISAVGAFIIINPHQKSKSPNIFSSEANGGGIKITEFSDEGTPFECSDIDVSTNAKNLNGTMISSRTPSVYSFSITVIPGSVADDWLASKFKRQAIQPNNNTASGVDESFYYDVTIAMPLSYDERSDNKIRRVTFTNARPKSGPFGPSTSSEGRISARTYTFEAEGVI